MIAVDPSSLIRLNVADAARLEGIVTGYLIAIFVSLVFIVGMGIRMWEGWLLIRRAQSEGRPPGLRAYMAFVFPMPVIAMGFFMLIVVLGAMFK